MNIISYCWVDSYPDRDMGLSSREERGWSDKRTQARMSGERAASALNIQIRTMQQTCRQIRHSRSRSAASATARHFPLDPNKSNPLAAATRPASKRRIMSLLVRGVSHTMHNALCVVV